MSNVVRYIYDGYVGCSTHGARSVVILLFRMEAGKEHNYRHTIISMGVHGGFFLHEFEYDAVLIPGYISCCIVTQFNMTE